MSKEGRMEEERGTKKMKRRVRKGEKKGKMEEEYEGRSN